MVSRQNNVYTITISENTYLVKILENKESKDNLEIYLDSKELSFKGLNNFRLFVNLLTDIAEELGEEKGEL